MARSRDMAAGCRQSAGCSSTNARSSDGTHRTPPPRTESCRSRHEGACYVGIVPAWELIALVGGGLSLLAARAVFHRRHQHAAANASGLAPIHDLSHLPAGLQKTALWMLS